ncbi:unnamed protein product [Amoebophrya sp. A25]|nr:unnamed protein product [Amoebophrya sp. A25]|eukprot:GSA25T00022664001.1
MSEFFKGGNREILAAVEAFDNSSDFGKLRTAVTGCTYDGRYMITSVLAAFRERHAVFEMADVFSGERKWLRYVWVNPVDRDMTMREFYVLRNITGVRCFPRLEHTAIEGRFVISVYDALPGGARTLAKELEGPGGREQSISIFKLMQIAIAIFEAVLELQAAGCCLLDLRFENIWLSNRTAKPDDLRANKEYLRALREELTTDMDVKAKTPVDTGLKPDPLPLASYGLSTPGHTKTGGTAAARASGATPLGSPNDDANPRQRQQMRLGLNQFRETLQVHFMELENLYIFPGKRRARFTRGLSPWFAQRVPLFSKFYGLMAADRMLETKHKRWMDVHLYKLRELGLLAHPELIRATARRKAPKAWEHPIPHCALPPEKQTFEKNAPHVSQTTGELPDEDPDAQPAIENGKKKNGGAGSGAASAAGSGDSRLPRATASRGAAVAAPGDDPMSTSISSSSGTLGGLGLSGKKEPNEDPFPRNRALLEAAQRWALGRVLTKLLGSVNAEQAPRPKRTLHSSGADTSPAKLMSPGKKGSEAAESSAELRLTDSQKIFSPSKADFSSPSRKCIGKAVYLLEETSTSADETVSHYPRPETADTIMRSSAGMASTANIDRVLAGQDTELQPGGEGGDLNASQAGTAKEEEEEALRIGVEEFMEGRDSYGSPTSPARKGRRRSSGRDVMLVGSPDKPSDFHGDSLLADDFYEGGDSAPGADVMSRVESVGLELEEIEQLVKEAYINGAEAKAAADRAAEAAAAPSAGRKAKPPVYKNGVALSGAYAQYFEMWARWVQRGLPEDGDTVKRLRMTLAPIIATKTAVHTAESEFTVLEDVIPLLLQVGYHRNPATLADAWNALRRRIDLSLVEDRFYSMPKLGGNSVFDLNDMVISSAHAWRLVELCQLVVESKAKIKLRNFATPLSTLRRNEPAGVQTRRRELDTPFTSSFTVDLPDVSDPEKSDAGSQHEDNATDGEAGGVHGEDNEDVLHANSRGVQNLVRFEYPASPAKRQPPSLGTAEQQILCRYMLGNSRDQRFILMKFKSKGGGRSENACRMDGTIMIQGDKHDSGNGQLKAIREEGLDFGEDASPSAGIGRRPPSPSKPPDGNTPAGSVADGGDGLGDSVRPPSEQPSARGSNRLSASASASELDMAAIREAAKDERRLFPELAAYDTTGELFLAEQRRKSKIVGTEYIYIPRSEKTVVDWETDALTSNTGFLYANLCEYLVLHGKLQDPLGSMERFRMDLHTTASSIGTKLRFLSLKNLKCFDKGALEVLQATSGVIEFLDLSGNCLSDQLLAEMNTRLHGFQKSRLKCLLLRDNSFTVAGAQTILSMLEALGDKQVLEVLDLAENCCAGIGVHLSRFYRKHKDTTSLHTISLRDNGLMSEDAIELSDAMSQKAQTSTPLSLNLEGNRFGRAGLVALLQQSEVGRINLRGIGENEGSLAKLIAELFNPQTPLGDMRVVLRSLRLLEDEPWPHDHSDPRASISYFDALLDYSEAIKAAAAAARKRRAQRSPSRANVPDSPQADDASSPEAYKTTNEEADNSYLEIWVEMAGLGRVFKLTEGNLNALP